MYLLNYKHMDYYSKYLISGISFQYLLHTLLHTFYIKLYHFAINYDTCVNFINLAQSQ